MQTFRTGNLKVTAVKESGGRICYMLLLLSDKTGTTRARRGLNVVSRELRSDRRERHTRGRSDTNASTRRMAGCTTSELIVRFSECFVAARGCATRHPAG